MTARTVFGVIVHANGDVTAGPVLTDLASLQAAVGGNIELVSLPTHRAHLYCNEEAVFEGLPLNTLATSALHILRPDLLAQELRGDVVFLGTGTDGDNDPLPARVGDLIRHLVKIAAIKR